MEFEITSVPKGMSSSDIEISRHGLSERAPGARLGLALASLRFQIFVFILVFAQYAVEDRVGVPLSKPFLSSRT